MNRVGRYEITELLGQGGMGTVYKAFDPLLARVVAVKVISAQLGGQPDLRERFFREARAAAQLDHPNIITVHDLGEQDGTPYLAMQFLEGQDLEHRMHAPEGMSLAAKLEVAIAIASGLAHAHACGVVHRDVKPANVFITNDGLVKILDFGLARLVTSELTRSNMMVGTVNYMAPEQLRSEKADHRADIFSLGVVLYELIGGKRPFQADSFASTMYKILEETPEPLERLAPEAPPRLIAVVDRAMAKSPGDRYQLMADLLRDLEAAYESLRGTAAAGIELRSAARLALGARPKSNPSAMASDPDAPTVVGPAQTPSPVRSRAGSPVPRTPLPATRPPTPAPTAPAAPPVSAGRRWMALAAIGAVAALAIVIAVLIFRRPPAVDSPQQPGRAGAPGPVAPSQASAAPGPSEAAKQPEAPERAEPAERPEPTERPEPPERRETRAPAATAPATTSTDAADRARLTRATSTLRSARAAAVSAGAEDEVPQLFGAADRQAAAGRAAASRGRLADAAARLEAAAALFDTARTTAVEQAAARREAARRAAEEAAARRETAAAPSRSTQTSPGAQTLAAPPPAPPPAPSSSPPAPAAAAGGTASRPPAPTAAAPSPAPPKPSSEPLNVPPETKVMRDAALAVLGQYIAALEHRDMDALKAIWPGLSGRERAGIQADFANASDINVSFDNPRVDVSGSRATVSGIRHYALRTRDGQDLRIETTTTLVLRRVNDEWKIDSVRHQK